jgi:hypothetical protein
MAQSRYPLIRRWTPEEHQQLLAMAAAGHRPDEIAQALGRTEPARPREFAQHSIATGDAKAERPMIKGVAIAALVLAAASLADQQLSYGRYTDRVLAMLREIEHSFRR